MKRIKNKKPFILTAVIVVILIGIFYYIEHNKKSDILEFYGNVDIRDVTLSFRVPGRIKEMKFEEGDEVKTGDIIATIDPRPYEDLASIAKAGVEAKVAIFKNAQTSYERAKNVFKGGAGSEKSYDDAKASFYESQDQVHSEQARLGSANTSLNDTKLISPSDGIIVSRIREVGAIVQMGQPVYTLLLQSPVWIRTFIAEPHLGDVHPGMIVKIHTDSGDIYSGKVGFISPVAEFTPKTVETRELRTNLVYRIKITVNDPNDRLRQGMPITVEIKKQKAKKR